MLYSSLSFMKNVIHHFQHCPKSIPHFLISFLTGRWFKGLEDGVSNVQSKSLQKDMGLGVVDALVEIVDQSLYCTSQFFGICDGWLKEHVVNFDLPQPAPQP